MFIISAALDKCGAIDLMARNLERVMSLGYRIMLLVILILVAIASAFVNNTAVVVVLIPVVLSLSRKMGNPASKFLIPLSYASIFGGCCTAIGTSTNILISSILVDHGMKPLYMFELVSIGLPLLGIGVLYLVAVGKYLLPVRETLMSMLSDEERKEYIAEAYVTRRSDLVGLSLKESGLLETPGVRVLEVVRNSVALVTALDEIVLKSGDRLVLACHPTGLMTAHNLEGVNFTDEMGLGLEQIAATEGSIVESVVGPTSSLVGKSIKEVNFRQQFRMVLLAVHRKGANLREKLGMLRFEFGDTLLMLGTDQAIENLRSGDEMILLDKPALPAQDMRKKMPVAIGILAMIILSVSFNLAPIVAAALMGVTLIFLTGCLKPKDGYQSIEWRILILIYGMLAMGLCMEKSGFTRLLAENMVMASESFISEDLRSLFILGAIYICTGILTEVLSNNATAVLMAPIAIGMAATLGVDARPFVIAVAIASSASFSTPIGYQTNTYVYGIGGYRFSDFWKIGLPLNLLYFSGCMFLIPKIWPL
jgi:di/tricarboxylate transporter